jgi:leucyl aminopeptidase
MVGTIQGAYDNGTGVRTVMELARAFSQVPTHRTMEFHFYNGEEEGALGSKEVAAEYATAGRTLSAYLGFDMTGIAWPVGGATTSKNCLCMWRGARDGDLDDVLRAVNYDFLGFPDGKQLVSVEGRNTRNSDEASWADKGYRTLRWAGLRRAADYPEYHLPRDTIATIDQVAGGREFFEQGLVNTLLSAYYTAATLDLDGVEAAEPAPVTDDDMTPEDLKDHGTRVHVPTPLG